MRTIFLLLFALPLMVQAQSKTDSTTIKMMSDEIMKNGKAYDLLRELTKNIGGRLAGSPQQQNAAIWSHLNPTKYLCKLVKPLIGNAGVKILVQWLLLMENQ
jgi:hypothetical protein